MSSEEAVNLNAEDRLKALTYQFVKLYERWAEDRQVLNKHLAYQAEMLKRFTDQVQQFSVLTPHVKQQLTDSIKREAQLMAEQVSTQVSYAATKEIDKTVRRLNEVVNHAAATLNKHETEIKTSFIWTILTPIGGAILASLIIALFLMPKPTLPLTDDQITTYRNGQFLAEFWLKLSKKGQKHLIDLANAPDISKSNNASTNNEASANSLE